MPVLNRCIPIRDLKNTAAVSQLCHDTPCPITVTKNGYADMVIMSAEAFDHVLESTAAIKLMQGLRDIEAGRTKPARQALAAVRDKYGV